MIDASTEAAADRSRLRTAAPWLAPAVQRRPRAVGWGLVAFAIPPALGAAAYPAQSRQYLADGALLDAVDRGGGVATVASQSVQATVAGTRGGRLCTRRDHHTARRRGAQPPGTGHSRRERTDRMTLTRQRVAEDIAELLFAEPAELTAETDLAELGLDSLRLTTLVDRWRGAGAVIGFAELAEEPVLGAWFARLGI